MTPIESMRVVARHLNALDISYTFLGAAVLPLLVDDPALVEIRPTKDVDVGVEIVTLPEHYVLEERLRTAGFRHDTREGAPICRWIVEEHVTADIMPTEAGVLGLESKWFREALQNATERDLGGGITAPVITPPYFLATKLAAYRDRGAADPYMSKDLEDIVTLLDGCEQIVSLVENCETPFGRSSGRSLKPTSKTPISPMHGLAISGPTRSRNKERKSFEGGSGNWQVYKPDLPVHSAPRRNDKKDPKKVSKS